jgi:hypothetical protein
MAASGSRYSRLIPWRSDERFKVAQHAVQFFNLAAHERMRVLLEKPATPGRLEAFSGMDFLAYLKKVSPATEWGRYFHLLEDLLAELAEAKILKDLGRTNSPFLGVRYGSLREITSLENQGWMWLAPALGAEFIRGQFAPVTVQLCGKDVNGVTRAGTGLVIAPTWILTCAHVVQQMTVSEVQQHQGAELKIIRTLAHSSIDVAALEIAPAVSCLPGLAFREPRVAEDVFTLGFPRIPFTREPALVMHKGEVTSPRVVTLPGLVSRNSYNFG